MLTGVNSLSDRKYLSWKQSWKEIFCGEINSWKLIASLHKQNLWQESQIGKILTILRNLLKFRPIFKWWRIGPSLWTSFANFYEFLENDRNQNWIIVTPAELWQESGSIPSKTHVITQAEFMIGIPSKCWRKQFWVVCLI